MNWGIPWMIKMKFYYSVPRKCEQADAKCPFKFHYQSVFNFVTGKNMSLYRELSRHLMNGIGFNNCYQEIVGVPFLEYTKVSVFFKFSISIYPFHCCSCWRMSTSSQASSTQKHISIGITLTLFSLMKLAVGSFNKLNPLQQSLLTIFSSPLT